MSPALRTEPKSQSFTREKSDLEKTSIKLKMFATYHLMTKHQTFQLFELTDKNTWKQMLIKRTWNQMLIQINLKTNDRPKMLENKSSSKIAWKQMLIQNCLKTNPHPKMLENKCSSTERGKGATLTSSTQAFDVIAAHNCPQLSSSSASTYHHCHHHQHQHHYQHIAVLYFLVIWVWKSMQRPHEQ